MNLYFRNPGFDTMITSILHFQREEETAFWSDSLYRFYPQLDKVYAAQLSFDERKRYITEVLKAVYGEAESEIDRKVQVYEAHWNRHRAQIQQALSEAFEMDLAPLFYEMRCDVSMNPVSPRFLDEERFEVFYLNSERGAIGTAIHEIIHFVWFYVWNQVFSDSYEEYECPSLKWILSEMVVESIMADERLASLNPYFPREQGGCIYPYFFDMRAGGELVTDVIGRLYKSCDIRTFMRKGYAFCQEHEQEIRAHIERSEQNW